MAGDTKADFDANYSIRIERYLPTNPPRGGRAEVRLGYQRSVMAETYLNPRWDALVPYIGLQSSDHVVIGGSAFGWSIDHIISLVPGINVVGVDISDYIDDEKDTDDSIEVSEYIIAVGLDPLTGRGLEIMNKHVTPGPKATVVVLKESMKTNQSRNKVRQALSNNIPTFIISEDMVNQMSDQDILDLIVEINKIPDVVIIHVMSGENDRTAENVVALTGHRCIIATSAGILKDVLP